MRHGGCQCGAVRYQIAASPVDTYVCHCRECQKQSASAFGISVIVAKTAFAFTRGSPTVWTRKAAKAGRIDCYFCPTCGSRLCHQSPAPDPNLSVKGGSLDQPPDLTTAHHIWTSHMLDGVYLPPEAETHPEEPSDS